MSNDAVRNSRLWIFRLEGILAWGTLVALFLALFPRQGSGQPAPPPTAKAGETARASLPPVPVPLGRYVTTDTHNWGDVPDGVVACDEVPFLCEGAIRLAGLRSAREGKQYPGAVWGVPVLRRGRRIHLLQAAENWSGTVLGTPYGKVTLHYANGEDRSFYLLFRFHGLDWYGGPQTPDETVADPNTKLCWAFKKSDGSYRRFFHTAFTNPLPEVEVTSADFVSPLGMANLWVFGLTLSDDPAPLAAQPARTVFATRLQTQRTLVTLRLEDMAGRRVADGTVAWQVIGSNYRVEFPPCPADARGCVVLDLPRRLAASVSFTATAANGPRRGGLVEREPTGDLPNEMVVKFPAQEAEVVVPR